MINFYCANDPTVNIFLHDTYEITPVNTPIKIVISVHNNYLKYKYNAIISYRGSSIIEKHKER